MGPYASSFFLQKILNNSIVKTDRDHLHVVLDSNPHIPSRTRHVLYGEESPVPQMIEACLKLEKYPVDVIVIPCNSASAWNSVIQRKLTIPILNIMKITANALSDFRIIKSSRIAVWGGLVTYKKETYRSYLESIGYIFVQHAEEHQKQIEYFIETIKLNKVSKSFVCGINSFASTYMEKLDVDMIIMGCTEFGCIDDALYEFKHVNSLNIYAKYVVKYAYNDSNI